MGVSYEQWTWRRNDLAAHAVNQDSTPLDTDKDLDESIGNHSLLTNDKPTNVSKKESQENEATLVTCEEGAAVLLEESVASVAALSVEALGSELALASAQKVYYYNQEINLSIKVQLL